MWGKSSIGKHLIISIIILAVGIPTAYAITITLGADPILVLGILDMTNNRIINVGTPTLDSDAATKGYVDSLFSCEGAGSSCAVGIGECQNSGINVCVVGSTQCTASAGAPSPEICDGLDNDCDGSTDEGNPGGGVACSTGLQGVCAAGTTLCSAGSITCVQDTVSSAEICDLVDNDCDGVADNNAANESCDDALFCTGPEFCQSGVCVSFGNPCPFTCIEIGNICQE